MFYEKITKSELKKMSYHGCTPLYKYEKYDIDTESYINLEILKTAEEVNSEYLNSQQIDICTEPTAEERIKQLEQDKEDLAANVYMLAEIIETLLGGVEDGQEGTTTEVTTD